MTYDYSCSFCLKTLIWKDDFCYELGLCRADCDWLGCNTNNGIIKVIRLAQSVVRTQSCMALLYSMTVGASLLCVAQHFMQQYLFCCKHLPHHSEQQLDPWTVFWDSPLWSAWYFSSNELAEWYTSTHVALHWEECKGSSWQFWGFTLIKLQNPVWN